MRRIVLLAAALALLPAAASATTLDDVKARGKLVCGVSEGLPGFSDRDQKGAWHGFDVDFCRALAAATLGDPDKVDYVPLSTEARFKALTDGKIDVLSRNSTWTLSRDVGLGIEFAGISFHDGQGFLTRTSYGVNSALELQGARICVITGTTTEDNAAAWFAAKKIAVTFERFATRPEARKAYAEEKCDAFTADRSALAGERSLLDPPEDHVILPEVISKEPLGPVTRQDDPAWTEIVRWTLFGLIDAEEAGVTSASVAADPAPALALGKPAVAPLHLSDDWLASAIGKVGNYGEIFERNLGETSPLGLKRGINALWTNGGILYAPPMQ
ncbi:MAG: amino acid ABC transporter substrate-binding protein [Rhizobiales bacterium]|nr:amino acid ABC transporter substrate-binding protein [Hyphomicrobiales bacterium]